MANLADDIRLVVEQVLKSPDISALLNGVNPSPVIAPESAASASAAASGAGIFPDLDSAVAAAATAQRELVALPLETRKAMIAAMRRVIVWNNADLSAQAVTETGLGNVADKQIKNALAANKTPGVEDIEPLSQHG